MHLNFEIHTICILKMAIWDGWRMFYTNKTENTLTFQAIWHHVWCSTPFPVDRMSPQQVFTIQRLWYCIIFVAKNHRKIYRMCCNSCRLCMSKILGNTWISNLTFILQFSDETSSRTLQYMIWEYVSGDICCN